MQPRVTSLVFAGFFIGEYVNNNIETIEKEIQELQRQKQVCTSDRKKVINEKIHKLTIKLNYLMQKKHAIS